MKSLTFRIPWLTGEVEGGRGSGPQPTSEWLVTNGLGGYSSTTVPGRVTRRYHGVLIAALERPPGRYVMLNLLAETILLPGGEMVTFDTGKQFAKATSRWPHGGAGMTEFRLELSLPVWRFEFDDAVLERDLIMPHRTNTTLVRYRLLAGKAPVRLNVWPLVQFRSHSDPVSGLPEPAPYRLTGQHGRYDVHGGSGLPPLRLALEGGGAEFVRDEAEEEVYYPLEKSRGYHGRGKLWTPGRFTAELSPGDAATLIASAEEWPALQGLHPEEAFTAERRRREEALSCADPRAHGPAPAQLVLAADEFLITSVMRRQEERAPSGEVERPWTIIAGYHWFTDWGRDTMISLEGITLITRRHREARSILAGFAGAIRDGLVPNRFPEGHQGALYYTADASLWLFHALDRYREATGDAGLVLELLPSLRDIVAHYRRGTRFNIGVDPADGLVHEGDPRYPLTWMDAKVGDWVVTPRRGKAVEINALWYNALRLFEGWLEEAGEGPAAREAAGLAEQVCRSFNARFWCDKEGYLYDVVDGEDGDDARCRPNQIFALSLRHPVLDQRRWEAVYEVVRQRLLTPVGLRSLAPGSPGYQPVYFGDRRARDAAYHQGTVWPWLLGPYIDAWLRVRPEDRGVAHAFLSAVLRSLGKAGIGFLAEIHDAEEPYTPRGCIAQAWSVAEVLRAYERTA